MVVTRREIQQPVGVAKNSWIFVSPYSGEKYADEGVVYEARAKTTTTSALQPQLLAAQVLKWNGSHKFTYCEYFSASDEPLNDDEMAFAYKVSLTARAATGADWTAANVVKAHWSMREDVKDKGDGDVPGIGNHFIFSEIPGE